MPRTVVSPVAVVYCCCSCNKRGKKSKTYSARDSEDALRTTEGVTIKNTDSDSMLLQDLHLELHSHILRILAIVDHCS